MTHMPSYVFRTMCQELMKQDIQNGLKLVECRLDASVYSNKQRWNEGKCRCECKELIVKRMYNKIFIWSTSNCECECDKSCDVGEYVDYKNCNCRNKLFDKLFAECSENIDGNKMLQNETSDVIPLNDYKKVFLAQW